MYIFKNLFLTVLLIQFNLVFSRGSKRQFMRHLLPSKSSRNVEQEFDLSQWPRFSSDSPENEDSEDDKWPLTSDCGASKNISKYDIEFLKKISSVLSTQNKKKTMEDFYIRLEPYGIFAILDGHGGKISVQRARYLLTKKLFNHTQSGQKDFKKCLPDFIADVEADLKATYIAKKKANRWHMDDGTTLCLIVAQKLKLTVVNVGDSRAVLYDENGEVIKQTRDHKPLDPIEERRIKEAGGKVKKNRVNGRLAMSRSLGDFKYKIGENDPISAQPEITVWNLDSRPKFLILASDGLWDTCTCSQAIVIVRNHYLIDDDFGARSLVEFAKNSPRSIDNITVIILILKDGFYKVGRSSNTTK